MILETTYFKYETDKLFHIGKYYCLTKVLKLHKKKNTDTMYLYAFKDTVPILIRSRVVTAYEIYEGNNVLYGLISCAYRRVRGHWRFVVNKSQFDVDIQHRIISEV